MKLKRMNTHQVKTLAIVLVVTSIVSLVAITMAESDGEMICIEKQNSENNNFNVSNIPDGRELPW
jgi:hypothetical protein